MCGNRVEVIHLERHLPDVGTHSRIEPDISMEDRHMTSESNARSGNLDVRNPFGVMDVPDPNGSEVAEFSAQATLEGSADDGNASAWGAVDGAGRDGVEGTWYSRWNGGADPTIPGDAKEKWKQGGAELRLADGRAFLLFEWDDGKRKGLIDARRDGATRLVGRYINLTDPRIMRPWIGLIVNNQRIDGRWSGGRLDFRR
jgi:hypothetical protein